MQQQWTPLNTLKKWYGITNMAQQLQSINLVAPAFKGINTEDSPIAQDTSFAEIADNAVIDKRGRIAARKGHTVLTTSNTPLGTEAIRAIKEFKKDDGSSLVFFLCYNKIFTGVETLTEVTTGVTITNDDWKLVNFNDNIYFFQRDYEPMVYSDDTNGLEPISTVFARDFTDIGTQTITPQGHEVLAAYGRLWTADFEADKSTVYWSDLLIGHSFETGTAGAINLAKVWPDGRDEIVALAAHNGLLIIFGKKSIVVYKGAEDPSTMSLVDTVVGVGCVNRDTVQHIGTDVVFLSHTGLRSFGRTIQEKSLPISTLSKTITKDITLEVQTEGDYFRSVYSPEESFYLISFVGRETTFCFDLRGQLEDGSFRATRWPNSIFTAYERLDNGKLYIGTTQGISEYKGYSDNNEGYTFKYYSPSLTFGDPSKLKFIKKIKPTILGTTNTSATIKFGYDFSTRYQSVPFTFPPTSSTVAEWGISDFNIAEFTGDVLEITRKTLNANGNGATVVVGLEAQINGSPLSLQEINILALIGKTV